MLTVVIPVFEKIDLEEVFSTLDNCKNKLPKSRVVLVGPRGFESSRFDADFVELNSQDFTSRESYSRLLISRRFFSSFDDERAFVICQVDGFILMDQRSRWCRTKYEYVGAPFFRSRSNPRAGFLGVGNGGFSLRRVGAALRVLESQRMPPYRTALAPERWMPDLAVLPFPRRFRKAIRVIREARRGVDWYTSHYSLNEDKFWSFRARLFDPSFRIAPVETALEFAFECFPRHCYELNGRRLPFGCHAWAKHDREFWEQFIDVGTMA
jgi:hypothetical protein